MRFFALGSLQAKLTLSVVAILVVISAFMLWFFPARMVESATRSEVDRADAVAALLGEAVGPGLDFDNEDGVKTLLEGLSTTRGARAAVVIREEGSVLSSWKGAELIKEKPKNVEAPQDVVQGDLLRVARPIKGLAGAKGSIYIVFSLAELESEKENVLRVTLIFSLLMLFFGSALSWYVGGIVARPIVALTEMTADVVRSGNFRRVIPVESEDEVGRLSRAFGRLLETLRSILSRTATLSSELGQVSERLDAASKTVAGGSDRIAERVRQSDRSSREMLVSLERVARAVEELSTSANETYAASDQVQLASNASTNDLTQMITSVETTASAIDKIAKGVYDTANRITGFDRVIDETRGSISEMQRSIEQVRKKTTDTAKLSQSMSDDAKSGMGALARTLEGLDDIRNSSEAVNEALVQLTTRILQISEILQVIDELSAQTNLLSLNASIIASQAGESGRAFSVVATEIKALAARSEGYTGQIEELVERVQADANNVTSAMNKGLESVERGVKLGHETERVLVSIVERAQNSNDMVQSIAAEGEQQVRHVEDVVAAVRRMGEGSRHLSDTAKKQAQDTALISEQSRRMRQLTGGVQASAQAQATAAQQISGTARNTSAMVEALGQAQSEQKDQSNRVLEAVQAIDVVTKQQRTLVNDLETTVKTLRQQAKDLERQLSEFQF
jgi:methyl-accepting chemotaxis protein